MLLIKAFLSGVLATSTRVQQNLEDGQERKGAGSVCPAGGRGHREAGDGDIWCAWFGAHLAFLLCPDLTGCIKHTQAGVDQS